MAPTGFKCLQEVYTAAKCFVHFSPQMTMNHTSSSDSYHKDGCCVFAGWGDESGLDTPLWVSHSTGVENQVGQLQNQAKQWKFWLIFSFFFFFLEMMDLLEIGSLAAAAYNYFNCQLILWFSVLKCQTVVTKTQDDILKCLVSSTAQSLLFRNQKIFIFKMLSTKITDR